MPIDKRDVSVSRKMKQISQSDFQKADELIFGGHAEPSLGTPYEVTVEDKMCYYAITIMKVIYSHFVCPIYCELFFFFQYVI